MGHIHSQMEVDSDCGRASSRSAGNESHGMMARQTSIPYCTVRIMLRYAVSCMASVPTEREEGKDAGPRPYSPHTSGLSGCVTHYTRHPVVLSVLSYYIVLTVAALKRRIAQSLRCCTDGAPRRTLPSRWSRWSSSRPFSSEGGCHKRDTWA